MSGGLPIVVFPIAGGCVGDCVVWGGLHIALRWCEIAKSQCLVENVESSASSWFFKAGGHTTNGVDFKICVFAGAELSSGVERRSCVFCEVSEDGEGV